MTTQTPSAATTSATPVLPSSLPPGMTLRTAPTPHDVAAVRTLVAGTGYFRPDEVDVAAELVDERLAQGEASGYFFVFADLDDGAGAARLVGYTCYGPIACTLGSYDLFWIAVDTRAQGTGLGRLLLRHTEAAIAAAGGRRVYAETSGKAQYASTRAFYERCGYRKEAELADFYDVGDAKVVYGLALT